MTRTVAIVLVLSAAMMPTAASAAGCAGGFFSFSNTLCSGPMQLRICLGDRGNSLLFVLQKGQSTYFQTAPNSSFGWSCTGEPAAVCPSAYCVNGPDQGGPALGSRPGLQSPQR
jgi:hypothetical protein